MSEMNNNGFNPDEMVKKINDYADKALKKTKEAGETVISRLDAEKKKAEIRSEVGHTSRDLSKLYEKLGRAYYNAKEMGTVIDNEKETFDLIRTKEKCIELLNEKLNTL